MQRLVILVAMGALALAASGAPAATSPDTKQMVLRLQDVSTGFERTKGRYVSNKQAAAETQVTKDFAKLGRIIGYEATFEKDEVVGLTEMETASSTYKTARGAHDSMLGSAAGAEKGKPSFRQLALGGSVGDEARLYKTTITDDGTKFDVVALLWRYKNVYSSIVAAGVRGSFKPAAVVAPWGASSRPGFSRPSGNSTRRREPKLARGTGLTRTSCERRSSWSR